VGQDRNRSSTVIIRSLDAVLVTWQAGGGAQVALALARLLSARGHGVRVIAPRELRDPIEAAGAVPCAYPAELEFDPTLGRRIEQQRPLLERLFFGRQLADALLAELQARPADVVVVDYLLRSAVAATELQPAPAALLIHTIHGFHGVSDDEDARRRGFDPVNRSRGELGLKPLPAGSETVTVALARRAAATLVTLPREFDDWPEPPPGVVHVGPLNEDVTLSAWEPPWAEGDDRPLVVVTLGTTYMEQEEVIGRVADALSHHDVRTVVLTGPELDPDEVDVPDGTLVERYVPHGAIVPGASLVVAHGGTGTLLAALSAGVPVLSLPLGRDQPANARRLEQLGLGRKVDRDAPPEDIAAVVGAMLAANSLHERVASFARVFREYGSGERAVAALEALVPRA
jgi:UDP:flavonoid glycosyltransferase YjiC (YdhE family)